MPTLYNDKLAVTKDELAPFYNWDNLRTTIERYKDKPYGIKKICSGGNGRMMLVDFDTLPKKIQAQLHDPRKVEHILERFYKTDGAAVDFYTTYRFPGTDIYLDTEYQERYITNASMIKALIALREARIAERRGKGGSIRNVNTTIAEDAASFQPVLLKKHKVQHTLPENERRLKEAMDKFEAEGFDSLISKKHLNQSARKVTDETQALLNNLFGGDKRKPTATEVHRRYEAFLSGYIRVTNTETGEQYDRTAFKKLSDATVKKYMASWVNTIGTHQARSTDTKLNTKKFKPHFSFEKPKYAGSIISIDDRQPPFKSLNGKRVWFYNAIDLGSEAFTCWVYGETKEGIIKEFYRQLVRNYATWGFQLPAEVEAEMSLNSSFTETFLREGAMFQYVKILPNNPRAKRIERYFGSLRYGLEKERDGWLARPNALSESNQPAIDIEKVPRLPYSEIIENALTDIETWNNQPHSVHTHLSRWEVFTKMQNPNLKPTNYIAILPHIGNRTPTSVNAGIIRLNYGECLLGHDGKISLGANLINLMKQVEGKEVECYWLDDDQGKVLKALVFIGTQYICEAIPKPVPQRAQIERTESDHNAYKIMAAYQATIDSFGRRQKQSIDTVMIENLTPAPQKHFVMPGLERRTYKSDAEYTDHATNEPDMIETQHDSIGVTPPARKTLKDRF